MASHASAADVRAAGTLASSKGSIASSDAESVRRSWTIVPSWWGSTVKAPGRPGTAPRMLPICWPISWRTGRRSSGSPAS